VRLPSENNPFHEEGMKLSYTAKNGIKKDILNQNAIRVFGSWQADEHTVRPG
jgi:hypothetical protein